MAMLVITRWYIPFSDHGTCAPWLLLRNLSQSDSKKTCLQLIGSTAMRYPNHRKTIGKPLENHRKTIGKNGDLTNKNGVSMGFIADF